MNKSDVFISYSSKNKNVADAIVNEFEQNGIKCSQGYTAGAGLGQRHKGGAGILSRSCACLYSRIQRFQTGNE